MSRGGRAGKEVSKIPYVNVPNDLSKVKTKLAFNLTKRQLVCFGIAAAVGIPTYLLARSTIGNTGAMFLMMAVALPAFLLAMYEKDGLPLEKAGASPDKGSSAGRKRGPGKATKRKAALSAQQTIPYLVMHPDGVCQLPGGLYTKTVEYPHFRLGAPSGRGDAPHP